MKTGKELLEDIGTGIADMMGTQPIDVIGRKERKGTEKKATYNYKYKKSKGGPAFVTISGSISEECKNDIVKQVSKQLNKDLGSNDSDEHKLKKVIALIKQIKERMK